MKLSVNASNNLIDELRNTKVEVIFSDKGYHGYPEYEFYTDTVRIREEEPEELKTTDGKVIGTSAYTYIPFEVIINDIYHTVQDTLFSLNREYSDHIKNKTEGVIQEIDRNINLRLGKWDILDYFKVLEMKLIEIRDVFQVTSIQCEGTSRVGIYNSSAKIICDRYHEIFIPKSGDWVTFVLTTYWEVQLNAIKKILKYLSIRKEIIEGTDDYVKAISELPTNIGNLIWNKTDTDLLELVTALIESGSIQNPTKDLTRKEAIEIFSQIFNVDIKDAESKLSRATERKKDLSPFLSKLKDSFETYVQKKDERMDNYRR